MKKLKSVVYSLAVGSWSILPFKSFWATLIKGLKLPLDKIYPDLWLNGPVKISYFDTKFRLFASKQDKSTQHIFWKGLSSSWDAVSIKIWGELSKRSEVIMDIGSNIGLYAIAAKTINPNATVYAFEPSRQMRRILQKNTDINQLDIIISPVALSSENGTAAFFDMEGPTAVASLKFNDNLKNNENLVSYEVEVSTLKKIVADDKIEKIDLISIDVEMNEPEVLEGMGDLIEKFRPTFIIEVLNNKIGTEIESHFTGLNYVYFSIDEKNGIFKAANLTRSTDDDSLHSFNFLVCPEETAEALNFL